MYKIPYLPLQTSFMLSACLLLALPFVAIGQQKGNQATNQKALDSLATEENLQYQSNYTKAVQMARQKGWPILQKSTDGSTARLVGIHDNGIPRYHQTYNLGAARTTQTTALWQGGDLGLSLSGGSMPLGTLGMWEVGRNLLHTHVELNGRIRFRDSPEDDDDQSSVNHATHVAGTMIASGVLERAKGMAHQASLDTYNSANDAAEMSTAARDGMLISNHSYGDIVGWRFNHFDNDLWVWFGDENISEDEDFEFGFYNERARRWDEIAFEAPYYLIVKSAGNDRNESGPGPGEEYLYYSNGDTVRSTLPRQADGGNDGFDSTPPRSVGKNILTVGAVSAIAQGYTGPGSVNISAFSAFGPTDDGRIKPDVVGVGVNVFSSTATAEDAYGLRSGTSMSGPNVSGSLYLLQEYWRKLKGSYLRAATLKGLAIHTALEAGTAEGPDYRYGWGLLNAKGAAEVLSANGQTSSISERILSNGETFVEEIYATGVEPLMLTLSWTDPPGTPTARSLNPTDLMLVNDLDIELIKDGQTFLPYVLNPQSPAEAASKGNNFRDNVEKVYVGNPEPGFYTVRISHKGNLSFNQSTQAFSLIVSGINNNQIDMAAMSVEALASFCDFDENTPMQARVANLGQSAIDSATVSLRLFNPSDSLIFSLDTLLTDLAPAANPSIFFTADLNQLGDYRAMLSVSAKGEQNPSNDHLTTTISADRISVEAQDYVEPMQDPLRMANWQSYNLNNDQDEAGNDHQWNYIPDGPNARTGNGYLSYYGNPAANANDWVVSPCVSLEEGIIYRVSFWYRQRDEGATQKFSLNIGTGEQPADMQILRLYEDETNTAYVNSTVFFEVETSGTYHFGWHVTSEAGNGNLYLDDVSVGIAPERDLAVAEIRVDADNCNLSAHTPVNIIVSNAGLNAVEGVRLSLEVGSSTGGSQTESILLPSIASGDTFTVPFTANLSDGDRFDLLAYVDAGLQDNALNDTLKATVTGSQIVGEEPIREGFERPANFRQFAVADVDGDGQSWTQANPSFARNGEGALVCLPAEEGQSDDWFFTSCYDLESGFTYQFDFYSRVFNSEASVDIEVWLTTDQHPNSALRELRNSDVAHENYRRYASLVEIEQSGRYYFAIRNVTEADPQAAIFIDDLSIRRISPLGTSEEAPIDIYLYPNPTNGSLRLAGKSVPTSFSISATDIAGKLVFSQYVSGNAGQPRVFDISNLKTGLYLFTLHAAEGKRTWKILKN